MVPYSQPGQTNVIPGDYTIATLPAAAGNAKKYVWVTDLFGGPGDYCISDGFLWRPVRPLALQSTAAADMTLVALLHAPTQVITGTIGLGVTRTVNLSTANVYPGAKFRITRAATGTGLLSILGNTLSLKAWADMEFDPVSNSWIQTASGGLL